MLEHDPGESALEYMRDATGLRQTGCPWRAMRDPYVASVLRAYRHWKTGQLEARYGRRIPVALIEGIEIYDAALNAVQVTDSREDRAERKAESERMRRELESGRGH